MLIPQDDFEIVNVVEVKIEILWQRWNSNKAQQMTLQKEPGANPIEKLAWRKLIIRIAINSSCNTIRLEQTKNSTALFKTLELKCNFLFIIKALSAWIVWVLKYLSLCFLEYSVSFYHMRDGEIFINLKMLVSVTFSRPSFRQVLGTRRLLVEWEHVEWM